MFFFVKVCIECAFLCGKTRASVLCVLRVADVKTGANP